MRAAWTAFAIASAFFLFEFVTRIEPGLATDGIRGFYHLSDKGFGTLSSLFFWVYAPMQIVVGLLLDRYGARRFILLGSLLCALGVLLFTATPDPIISSIGRALTGFGASFAFVAALWLVNHWFLPQRFALLSGAVNAVGMLGTAIGGVILSDAIAGGRAGAASSSAPARRASSFSSLPACGFANHPRPPAPRPADRSSTSGKACRPWRGVLASGPSPWSACCTTCR